MNRKIFIIFILFSFMLMIYVNNKYKDIKKEIEKN